MSRTEPAAEPAEEPIDLANSCEVYHNYWRGVTGIQDDDFYKLHPDLVRPETVQDFQDVLFHVKETWYTTLSVGAGIHGTMKIIRYKLERSERYL